MSSTSSGWAAIASKSKFIVSPKLVVAAAFRLSRVLYNYLLSSRLLNLTRSTHRMTNSKSNCPHCGAIIPPEASRAWRPFSCPQCSGIVDPRPAYHNFGTIGCFGSGILCAAIGWVVSQRWLEIIVGFLAGAVVGILVANFIIWFLDRLWPRSPKLLCYALRDDPGLLPGLSGLLDSSAGAESWEVGLESRLNSLRDQISLDDSLVGAAISAAQQCKIFWKGKNRKT